MECCAHVDVDPCRDPGVASIDLSAHVEHHQDNHHGHGHGNNPIRFHPITITSLLASYRAVRAGYVDVASIKAGGCQRHLSSSKRVGDEGESSSRRRESALWRGLTRAVSGMTQCRLGFSEKLPGPGSQRFEPIGVLGTPYCSLD